MEIAHKYTAPLIVRLNLNQREVPQKVFRMMCISIETEFCPALRIARPSLFRP